MFARKYGKTLASFFFAVLTAAYAALSSQPITSAGWVSIAIAFTNAVGVYLVPLAPQMRYGKTAVAAALAVLQVLTTAITGGINPSEWVLVLIAVGQALGVAAAPAQSTNGVRSGPARLVAAASSSQRPR